jgi:uncharacterized DUF497 family protein
MAGAKLLIVSYTMRGAEGGEGIYRIISAPEAEPEERRIYEEGE